MKGFNPVEWPRAIVHPISNMFSYAVDGLSGKSRRRLQILKDALDEAEGECDRLRQEIKDLVQYTDGELTQLKQTVDELTHERDELQLKVYSLEEALEQEALTHAAAVSLATAMDEMPLSEAVQVSSEPLSQTATPTDEAASLASALVDLSNFRLALVGGHPSTRRGVIQELQSHYGLKHCVEIPRMSEANTSRNRVKSKIYRCNLVVLITGYMSHRLTEIVFSLKDAGALAGDVLQLNCKGKSGVLRGILEHVESNTI